MAEVPAKEGVGEIKPLSDCTLPAYFSTGIPSAESAQLGGAAGPRSVDEATADAFHRGAGPVLDGQLLEDALDILLHGGVAPAKSLADLAVGEAGRDEPEQVDLHARQA